MKPFIEKNFFKETIPEGVYNFIDGEKHIKFPKKINDLIEFGILKDGEFNFYSENDLKDLSEEQQTIFKELKENPIIIIDGVEYK